MPLADTPGQLNLNVYAGQTFSKVLTFAPVVDLTGYDARLMARTDVTAGTAIVSLGTALGITLGGTAGSITLAMSATVTAALGSAFSNSTTALVYDLELQSGAGDITRLVQGQLTVFPEVTR